MVRILRRCERDEVSAREWRADESFGREPGAQRGELSWPLEVVQVFAGTRRECERNRGRYGRNCASCGTKPNKSARAQPRRQSPSRPRRQSERRNKEQCRDRRVYARLQNEGREAAASSSSVWG